MMQHSKQKLYSRQRTEQFGIWKVFLCHHILDFWTVKNGRVFWPTPYILVYRCREIYVVLEHVDSVKDDTFAFARWLWSWIRGWLNENTTTFWGHHLSTQPLVSSLHPLQITYTKTDFHTKLSAISRSLLCLGKCSPMSHKTANCNRLHFVVIKQVISC